jgi:hypothetical protein
MKAARKFRRLSSFAMLLGSITTTWTVQAKVDNFVLLDQHGQAHELYYLKNKQAIVLMAYSSNAKNIDDAIAALNELRGQHTENNIDFYLLDSNPQDKRVTLQQQELLSDLTVMMDEGQLVAQQLGFSYLGEVQVVRPDGWGKIYQGPVVSGNKTFLKNVLAEIAAGKAVTVSSEAMPSGSQAIAFTTLPSTPSYSDDIAPLLQEKCVSCHRVGGIGPWAMNNYQMIQGFAPMIREVVLTKRMPPWHADPHVNTFNDDISLSVAQQKMLVSWINAGAPRGEGNDPLLHTAELGGQWVLGEPDLVIDLPAFEVPATGSVDYQFFETPNPLDKDVWVKAIHIIPGERAVLHHAISTFGKPDDPSKPIKPAEGGNEGSALLQQQLMTFVPGNEYYVYPDDTALLLTKGSSFFTQMHYTTSGKAATDKSRIGLYFRDDAPKHVLRHFSIVNPWMRIPPMEAAHAETAYFQPDRDIVVYSLFPHAHYRGRSSKFVLRYPDGRDDLLLSVPNYDFNWQRYFQLQTPLEVPAGSKIVHTTVFDNSPQSDTNPDPSATVLFGLQSWEEMLYGGVSYRYKEGGLENTGIEEAQFQADLFIGALDANQDSKLEVSELPEPMQNRMGGLFPWVDGNKNSGLENAELKRLFEMMAERRQSQAAQQ